MEDRSGSVNILVVDDMPVNIELLKALLEPRGYHVIGAASGADALKIIDKSVPDLILLDVMMPEMNGFETCRRIREKKELPYIPIIFITASELDQQNAVEGLDSGGDDYIRKPFQTFELISRIKTNLRVKSTHDQLSKIKSELSRYVSLSTVRMIDNMIT
ncbi:MAG: response regulator, partial [Deltaproteobacteria bacterium]|nr:response regulator [Deltaproteobacteria bacterium]